MQHQRHASRWKRVIRHAMLQSWVWGIITGGGIVVRRRRSCLRVSIHDEGVESSRIEVATSFQEWCANDIYKKVCRLVVWRQTDQYQRLSRYQPLDQCENLTTNRISVGSVKYSHTSKDNGNRLLRCCWILCIHFIGSKQTISKWLRFHRILVSLLDCMAFKG